MANPLDLEPLDLDGEDEENENITLKNLDQMKVPALKNFLRVRCITVSGNKEVLVSKVYAALLFNIPIQVQGKEYIRLRNLQYQKIIERIESLKDPLDENSGYVWLNEEKGMKKWPNVNYASLVSWLNSHEVLTQEKMDKCVEKYRSGWTQEIYCTSVGDSTILKNKCTRSQAISNLPHECWLACDEDGRIEAAFCSCVAGLSETCNHVTGLVCRAAEMVIRGMNVGTAHLQQWSKASSTVNVDTSQTVNGVLGGWQRVYYDQKGKKMKTGKHPMFTEKRRDFEPIIPGPNLPQLHKYRELLLKTAPDSTMSKMTMALRESTPAAVPRPRPPPPRRLKTMKELAEIFLKGIQHSDSDEKELPVRQFMTGFLPDYVQNIEPNFANDIHEATLNQRTSFVWSQQRLFRITGTKMRKVFVRQNRIETEEHGDVIDNTALLNEFTKPISSAKAKSLQWGLEKEEDAKKAYVELEGPKHENFSIREAGLAIDADRPYIAASPDALIDCSCCGPGILEIKCPYTIRFQDANVVTPDYVTEDGLEPEHSFGYYLQVQSQMAITGRHRCEFFVWTDIRRPDDPTPLADGEVRGLPLIRHLSFHAEHWKQTVLPVLDRFYESFVGPVLFGRQYQRPAPAPDVPVSSGTKGTKGRKRKRPVKSPSSASLVVSEGPRRGQPKEKKRKPPPALPFSAAVTDLPSAFLCTVCEAECVDPIPGEGLAYAKNSIECDRCLQWTHLPCAKISRVGRRPTHFVCILCKQY